MKPLRILFFGSDAIALQSLRALHASPQLAAHLEVVAPPDTPRGRRHELQPQFLKAACAALDPLLLVHQPPKGCGFRLRGWDIPKASPAASAAAAGAAAAGAAADADADDDGRLHEQRVHHLHVGAGEQAVRRAAAAGG
jgi:hypothetical protein